MLSRTCIILSGARNTGIKCLGSLRIKKLCETVLNEVAERHGIKIAELSVMPEHVHIVGDIPPVMSVSKAYLTSLKRCIQL